MSRLFRLRVGKRRCLSQHEKVWIRRASAITREKKKKKKRFEIRDAHNYARLLIAAFENAATSSVFLARPRRLSFTFRSTFLWRFLQERTVVFSSSSSPNKAEFLVDGKTLQEKSRREIYYILHIIIYSFVCFFTLEFIYGFICLSFIFCT